LSKFISSILGFLILYSGVARAAEPEELAPARKTILILSSTGGGGHIAAANTLQSLVGEEYDLKVVYPINQLRIFGVPSAEQIYNTAIRTGWIRSMNFIARHLAPPIFHSRQGKVEKIISSYIKMHKPDLLISLIPFVNYPASEAARKNEIPFLLITTDNDLKNWAFEMERIKHPQYKVTIGSDLATSKGVLIKKRIPESIIETVGLPLRPEFIAQKNREKILSEFHFPTNKEIILIMMGGAGGETAYKYANKVGRMNLNAHLVVIAGRNNKLKKDLERLELHPSNTLSAFGFTDRVSDLMAVSNLLITKPGPGTINEAIAMKLPMLIDNTDISLFWERANVDIVLKYGIGQRVKNFQQLRGMLTSYLKDEKVLEKVNNAFSDVPANQFHLRIPGIIKDLLASSEAPKETETSIELASFESQ
jgi:processive 1,2-diacylglycerol beta-glucosyltransferase